MTEFGTCAYRGAGERGGLAWQPPEGAVPDEREQVRYFTELLDIFEEEGVDTALWFTFAAFHTRKGADLTSYGVVRMLDETRWEPREVSRTMAARYAEGAEDRWEREDGRRPQDAPDLEDARGAEG